MRIRSEEIRADKTLEPNLLIAKLLHEVTSPQTRNALTNLLTSLHMLRDENEQLHQVLEIREQALQEKIDRLEAACDLLNQQSQTIAADLERAARIQHALLPHKAPNLPGYCVAALYQPSERVGGDFYDLLPLDANRFAFCIADAAGHGLSAALLAVLFRMHLHQCVQNYPSSTPKEVLSNINTQIANECASLGIFISAVYGIIDTQHDTMHYASAGHPPILLQRASGKLEWLPPTGPALGLSPADHFEESLLHANRGDRFLCYTDGLCDGWPEQSQQVSDVLVSLLEDAPTQASDLVSHLYREACARRTSLHEKDDVTLLLICATDEPSCLDHAAPGRTEPVVDSRHDLHPSSILVGTDKRGTVFRIAGRGEWIDSSPLYERATLEIREGHALTIDLSECTHLDSTFLGTLHEVIAQADQRKIPVSVQGVRPQVERDFDELGMTQVLSHIEATSVAQPTSKMTPLHSAHPSKAIAGERLLKAHEALASINATNRAQFDELLQALRRELDR